METCSVHKQTAQQHREHRDTKAQNTINDGHNKRKCLFMYDLILVKMNDSSNFITPNNDDNNMIDYSFSVLNIEYIGYRTGN